MDKSPTELKQEILETILEQQPNQKFFVQNIGKWNKYFIMDSYYEGGGGIVWNVNALTAAPFSDLVDIHIGLAKFRRENARNIVSILKKVVNKWHESSMEVK